MKFDPRGDFRLEKVSWKDKILDYEIEIYVPRDSESPSKELEKIRFSITRLKWIPTANIESLYSELEKIRFSITRLKWRGIKDSFLALSTWKDKILDYEIEISVIEEQKAAQEELEKIRFSITRLKWIGRIRRIDGVATWKDKILDYEIEINGDLDVVWDRLFAWKDKILDYEIEITIVPSH